MEFLKSTTMECLRKAEEKSKESENRMPSIVEAGALAVATTVKPHSLTSNNDITPIASFPKECLIEESFYRLPVSQKPPRRVNTVIQHNLERNRLLVMVILFAASGFVMWNGEEWRALWEKKEKEEDEKEEDEKEEDVASPNRPTTLVFKVAGRGLPGHTSNLQPEFRLADK